MNEFEILVKNDYLGYYESCEVTQLFIRKKSDDSVFNLFILVSFEERPYEDRNQKYLTDKKGIKIDSEFSLGVQRYHLTLNEAEVIYNKLVKSKKWDDQLQLGNLKELRKQFIPSREGNRINQVLKNNFHSGAYILEFFDESKEHLDVLLEMVHLSKLNKLSEKIKELVPINLTVARDRMGNIIFQFPNTLLRTNSQALKSWDGIKLHFNWHSKVKSIPDCIIQTETTLDKNYTGGAVTDYNKEKSQVVEIGSLDQINHIKIWRKNPNLLLSTFDGSYIRDFILNGGIVSHEPRIFKIADKEEHVSVTSQGFGGRKNSTPKYTDFINNVVYTEEKNSLERKLSFKQFFSGSTEVALMDLRELIKRNDKNGVYLWDPYLRSVDILKTLFFSPSNGVPLKAIGSINSETKKLYKNKNKPPDLIIKEEANVMSKSSINDYGLNLEFRMQHSQNGWSFHDRFLIFPGHKLDRPKAYSLGTSINAIGKSHHIIQEVSHPQPVIDAFDQLWSELANKDCIVWKFP